MVVQDTMFAAEDRNCTRDTLFDGRLIIHQPKTGYRFSRDAVLLARLTTARSGDRIVDLGAGCGVVALIMAYRGRGQRWWAVEIQEELRRLAEKNVRINGLSERIQVIGADLRRICDVLPREAFDLVVSNPPYRRIASGRLCKDRQRAIARHELAATVKDVFRVGNDLLRAKGRLALVYPAVRLQHLMVAAKHYDFSAKRLTLVYSRPAERACLVHLECIKGGGEELHVEPSLVMYEADGSWSEAMRRIYEMP